MILDSRGEAVIFWKGSYKIQLQDATGAPVWTVDNVTAVPAFLFTNLLDAPSTYAGASNYLVRVNAGLTGLEFVNPSTVLLNLFAQSAAELAAAVTPTFYYYLWGDVRRYGAIGDDTTDAQGAFTKALLQSYQPTGAAIHIPAGKYQWLTLQAAAVAYMQIDSDIGPLIYGDGPDKSILKFPAAGVNVSVLAQRAALGECKGLVLRDFSIDCQGTNATNGCGQLNATALQLNGQTGFIVDNVLVKNASRVSGASGIGGIGMSNGGGVISPQGELRDIEVTNTSKGGIDVTTGSDGIAITKGYIHDVQGNLFTPGLQINGGLNVRVDGLRIKNTQGAGVLISDGAGNVADVVLNGVQVTGAGTLGSGAGVQGDGLRITKIAGGIQRVTVNACEFIACGQAANEGSGIYAIGGTGLFISNTICQGNNFDGYRIGNYTNVQITGGWAFGNNQKGTTGSGIRLENACDGVNINGLSTYDSTTVPTQNFGMIGAAGATLNNYLIQNVDLRYNINGPISMGVGFLGIGRLRFRGEQQTANAGAATTSLSFMDNTDIFIALTQIQAKKSDSTARANFTRTASFFRNGGNTTLGALAALTTIDNVPAYVGPTLAAPGSTYADITCTGVAAAGTVNWRWEADVSVL